MFKFCCACLIATMLVSISTCLADSAAGTFLKREVEIHGSRYPYAVYLPFGFHPSRYYSLILFLHGAGERGNDGLLQTQVGLGEAIRKNPERFRKAIVIFPQAPKDTRWLDDPAEAAMRALDQTIAEFRVDQKHVYLTGISMGGYGTWYLVTQFPKRFAAIVPICSGILPSKASTSVKQLPITIGAANPYAAAAKAVPHIPIWIFHGAVDSVIPVTESRQMFKELKTLGAKVQYTEYPELDHNSWDRAYSEPKLWTWLFAQHLQ